MSAESAEKALVARILLDPTLMDEVDGLSAEDFGVPDMATIFGAMQRRWTAGESFDSVLLGEETGVEIDVLELSPAASAPIERYIGAIKDASERRRVLRILDQARANLVAGTDDPLDTITTTIERIADERGFTGLRRSAEVVRNYRDEFARRVSESDGIPYGIKTLDDALLPMRAGRLVVFASRPGIGKTALAETVADYAASRGPVLFVSLEMTAEELTDRAMARMSGISAQEIMRGQVEIERLDEHLIARGDTPVVYMDDGGATTAEVLAAAQKVKASHKGELALVVVDYLQLMGDKGDNEVYRVGAISHGLKRLAMKLKVPVLAMAQLNRNIEMERRRPRLADLRDSGAIEQDADVVMIMQGVPWEPERTLHILKQRQGHTGELKLYFDGDTQRWEGEKEAATSW